MKVLAFGVLTVLFLFGGVQAASADPSSAPDAFHALNGITVSAMSDEDLAKVEGQGDGTVCCIGGVPRGIVGIPPNPVFPTDPIKTFLFNHFIQGIPPNPIAEGLGNPIITPPNPI